jgi:hypothetical protein
VDGMFQVPTGGVTLECWPRMLRDSDGQRHTTHSER